MIDRCERADGGSYDHHGTRPSLGKQCIGRLHAEALVATSRNYGFRALARQDLIQVRLDRLPPGRSPCSSPFGSPRPCSPLRRPSRSCVTHPALLAASSLPWTGHTSTVYLLLGPHHLTISQPSPCPPCPLSHILHYFCNGREAGVHFNHLGSEYYPTARSVHPATIFQVLFPVRNVSCHSRSAGKACLRCRKRKMVSRHLTPGFPTCH